MRKGFKITAKITMMIVLPILFISIASIVISGNNQEDTAYRLIEEKLEAVTRNVDSLYNVYAEGDYSYEDEIFKKGDKVLTENYALADQVKKESKLEVTLFWGNKRIITTVEDAKGQRAVGTTIDADFAKDILNGKSEKHFTKTINIAGSDYCGYYIPMKQKNGDVVGLIFTGRAKADVVKEIRDDKISMAVGMSVIFVISLVVVVILIQIIIKALKHAISRLNDVSSGKLDFEMPSKLIRRADEIGEMANAIQELINEFRTIISNLKNKSSELEEFSSEFEASFDMISKNIMDVNAAVDDIANGAGTQANETLSANSKIADMGKSIEDAAIDIQTVNQNSDKMKKFSLTAEDTMKELVTVSEQTSRAIEEIREQTNLTNDSAQAIQTATDMITSIATQTNLLSLNASIEAARAGEDGAGFAVVANEIRTLSEKSKKSADEILSIISELILNSNSSVESMNAVSESVQKQNAKLIAAKNMFESLNAEIASVSIGVDKIGQSMEKLGQIKEMVMENVSHLTGIAEENAASTEETSASMSELRSIIKQCHKDTQELVMISTELSGHTKQFTL